MRNVARHEVAYVHEGAPIGVPAVVQELRSMGFAHEDIALAVQASPRSVDSWASGGSLLRTNEDRLMALYGLAGSLSESVQPEYIGQWFRTPSRFLGWERPLDLFRGGQDRRVQEIIEALKAGYAT